MTLEEITDEWEEASCNYDREPLSERTFHRRKVNLESQFGIKIACEKVAPYRYYIDRKATDTDSITEWMLSCMRMTALSDMLQHHNKVMLDRPPLNTALLEDILSAIDKHHALQFTYTTAYGDEKEMTLVPAFVRFFRQRWYVIGMKLGEGDDPKTIKDERRVRVLPFDRIDHLRIICSPHRLSKKMAALLTPDEYYAHCFGVMRVEDVEPVRIRIRAFYPEFNYIEEVPLHSSQRFISAGADNLSKDYELYLRPTRDFLQQLLWHGRNIAVISPESLRQDMLTILRNMTESYETGQCRNGEE